MPKQPLFQLNIEVEQLGCFKKPFGPFVLSSTIASNKLGFRFSAEKRRIGDPLDILIIPLSGKK